MDTEAKELLMSFIGDGYTNTGKITKATALKMMKFVANNSELQDVVNTYDPKDIRKFKLK